MGQMIRCLLFPFIYTMTFQCFVIPSILTCFMCNTFPKRNRILNIYQPKAYLCPELIKIKDKFQFCFITKAFNSIKTYIYYHFTNSTLKNHDFLSFLTLSMLFLFPLPLKLIQKTFFKNHVFSPQNKMYPKLGENRQDC